VFFLPKVLSCLILKKSSHAHFGEEANQSVGVDAAAKNLAPSV
jgi:hypothetical protein